jgi:hypothetical protein
MPSTKGVGDLQVFSPHGDHKAKTDHYWHLTTQ